MKIESSSSQKERYERYIKSDHWRTLRRASYQRANHKCESCDKKNYLNGHHLRYRDLFNCTTDDIMMLCETCHYNWHAFHAPSVEATRDFVRGFLSAVRQLKDQSDVSPKRNITNVHSRKAERRLAAIERKESVLNNPVVQAMVKSESNEYKFRIWARDYFSDTPMGGAMCTVATNLHRSVWKKRIIAE